jgi:hypothetical protein
MKKQKLITITYFFGLALFIAMAGGCGGSGSSSGDNEAVTSGEITFAAAPVLDPAPATLPQQNGMNICEDYRFGGRDIENLEVPDGKRCVLEPGVSVDGNVELGSNSEFYGDDVFIGGNLQGQRTCKVFLSNSVVGGSIQPELGGEVTIISNNVTGDIQLVQNRGALFVRDNVVNADIQIFGNSGGASINGNQVDGNLQCKENIPAPTGSGNIVQGNKEDQCSNF